MSDASRRRAAIALLGSGLLLSSCGERAFDPTGTWFAEPEHEGSRGRVVLEIVRAADGARTALLTLPDIDAREIPIGAVAVEGDRVAIGPFELHPDPREDTLTGALPEAIVPVHSIEATFRRIDHPPVASDPPLPVPLRAPTWHVEAGAPVWAGLACVDRSVLVGDDAGVLRALDLEDGREGWRYRAGGAIRATPAVRAGAVIVLSDDGMLARVRATDGGVDWSTRLVVHPEARTEPGEPGYRYDHQASSATIEGDRIWIGAGDSLHAVDLGTGAVLWTFETEDTVTSTPLLADGRVVFGSFDGRVYAVDAETGALAWSHDTGAPVPSSPATYGGLAIVGSRSYDLLALRVEDGTPAWTRYNWFSWVESSATVRNGVAYVGSSDAQRLYALDASTGEETWSFDTGGSAWARPAVDGDVVYIGAVGVADYIVAHAAGFHAVERRTGTAIWTYPSERVGDGPFWGFAASPCAIGGKVVAATLDGSILGW